MRRERQIEYLRRVAEAGPRMSGLHAEASMVNEAATYTDPSRFDRERDVLFRRGPVCFALSCEISEPGAYRSAVVGGVPVIVIRQPDGSLRAIVNACRHRGAPIVEEHATGDGLRALSCPYHAWTYELDGRLRGRPGSEGAFDDVAMSCDLHPLAVAERYGLVFVQVQGADDDAGGIGVDGYLAGAQDDLGALGLDRYVPIESRTATWNVNWKLIIDTFSEQYHIRTLHASTIAPHYLSYSVLADAFGAHALSIGLRRSILDELTKPVEQWSLLPHATIQYLLVPGVVLVHQLDHLELWRLEPLDVRTTRTTATVFAPSPPHSDRARDHFVRNLDILVDVTGTEDFPLMERIQATLESGALPEVVYGRNEPPLIHYHRSVNAALDRAL